MTMDIGGAAAAGLHPILLDPYDDHPRRRLRADSSVEGTAVTVRSIRSANVGRSGGPHRLGRVLHPLERLASAGHATHGEADFIASLGPPACSTPVVGWGGWRSSWPAGPGVVGVDLDGDLLAFRAAGAALRWVHTDLATMQLDRRFDVVAMPGNVMIFCDRNVRRSIVERAAAHLESGGHLVAGFTIEPGPDALTLAEYDLYCAAANLQLVQRLATWDVRTYAGGDYAVSVHRQSVTF